MPNHHFLVVDDAAFIRNLVKKGVLGQYPECKFSEAPNGVDAQKLLEESNDIDLILCDWEMPEMDGKELLEWVKSNQTTQQIPFIMVTSRGDKSFIVEAAKAGVCNYIVKPFSNEKLVDKISAALDGNSSLLQTPQADKEDPSKNQPQSAPQNNLTQETNKSAPSQNASNNTSNNTSNNALNNAKKNPKKKESLQPSAKNKKLANKGKAFVRFTSGRNEAAIRELSLKGISASMDFAEKMPSILEPVVVDIEADKSDKIAVSMNGYVFSMEAGESKPDAKTINIAIIFVDKDTGKMDALSKLIARGRAA